MQSTKVKRHELKFHINRADYDYTKRILDKLMINDPYQKDEEGYFVRSLYFDDIYETAMEEKLAGVEVRNKYRLRIYSTHQDWAKIERKSKFNNYIQKSTGIISKEDAEEIIQGNYECLISKNNSELNTLYFDFKTKYMRPVVIVDYVRDSYYLDFNNIRVTFDKKLRRSEKSLELFNTNLDTEPIQREDLITMEVKYNNFLPEWFKNQISLVCPVHSAISKYCMSRLPGDNYWNY